MLLLGPRFWSLKGQLCFENTLPCLDSLLDGTQIFSNSLAWWCWLKLLSGVGLAEEHLHSLKSSTGKRKLRWYSHKNVLSLRSRLVSSRAFSLPPMYRKFMAFQRRHPVFASAATGGAVMSLGDSAVQLADSGTWDYQRNAVVSAYNGGQASPPIVGALKEGGCSVCSGIIFINKPIFCSGHSDR